MTTLKMPRLRISNSLSKNFPKDFFKGRKERSHQVSPRNMGKKGEEERLFSVRKFRPVKLNSKLMRIPSPVVENGYK